MCFSPVLNRDEERPAAVCFPDCVAAFCLLEFVEILFYVYNEFVI